MVRVGKPFAGFSGASPAIIGMASPSGALVWGKGNNGNLQISLLFGGHEDQGIQM